MAALAELPTATPHTTDDRNMFFAASSTQPHSRATRVNPQMSLPMT